MRLAVKKLHVEDAAKLQALVVENLDGIEPGLATLDARLLLGHSTIDIVAMDAAGTLVLVAVGLTANEEMILKAVEAYSWCLEYPHALQRLYSGCVLSEERPPRLLFVVERMSDAFQRKIKQLGFPEVDCVEVRHLEVDGVPTVYFEVLSRIRRLAAPPVVERVPQASVPAPDPTRGPAGENVISMSNNATVRAAAPRPGKPGQPETTVNGARAGASSVVSMINRQAVAPSVDLPRPAVEPVVLRRPEPVPAAPVIEAKGDADEWVEVAPLADNPPAVEPVVPKVAVVEPSAAEPLAAQPVVAELNVPEPVMAKVPEVGLSAPARPSAAEVKVAEPVAAKPVVSEDKPAVTPVAPRQTMTMRTIAPAAPAATPAPLPPLAKPVATSVPSMGMRPVTPKSFSDTTTRPSLQPVAKPAAEPTGERVSFKDLAQTLLGGKSAEPRTEAPALAAAAPTPTVVTPANQPVIGDPKAEPAAAAQAAPALTVESLAAMAGPTAPAEQAPVADPAKQVVSALPQEFEGLTFPNDGVLTRQWMDFLNQMSTTK